MIDSFWHRWEQWEWWLIIKFKSGTSYLRFDQIRPSLCGSARWHELWFLQGFWPICCFISEYLSNIIKIVLLMLRFWCRALILQVAVANIFPIVSFIRHYHMIGGLSLINFLWVKFLRRHWIDAIPQLILKTWVIIVLFETFHYMSLQLLWSVEWFRALLALIRSKKVNLILKIIPELLMPPLVINFIAFGCEPPPTVLALKWFFPGMSP
jgi:hypothetical protein